MMVRSVSKKTRQRYQRYGMYRSYSTITLIQLQISRISRRARPGYRPVFGDFVPVPVPAGILVLAGILAGIFPK